MPTNAVALLRHVRKERCAEKVSHNSPPAAVTNDQSTTTITSSANDARSCSSSKLCPVATDERSRREWREQGLCVREHEVVVRDSSVVLHVSEDPLGRWNGGNGATVWDGAVALARRLEEEPALLCGASVLELGAGCGLVSLVAAALGARRVVATDRLVALPLLRRNAAANEETVSEAVLSVAECDWESPPATVTSETETENWDLVLGADLVFPSNRSSHEALATLLATLLLQRPRRRGPRRRPIALLVHEARRPEVEQEFWESLREKGVRVVSVSESEGLELFRLDDGRHDDDDAEDS